MMVSRLPSTTSNSAAKNVLILANPLAGRGLAKTLFQKARQFCHQHEWNILASLFSEYAGHIEHTLVKEHAPAADLIILIGGDGTLRELVAGLYHENLSTEIAFIPLGNANVVARELNIPLNPEKALAMLKHSQIKKVDMGILEQEQANSTKNRHVFLAMLEIGIGAKIVHLVNHLRLGRLKRLYQLWGDIVYALAGILAFAKNQDHPIHLQTDDLSMTSKHIVISNMQTYAKGWAITPDANHSDGQLDIAIDKKGSRRSFITTFLLAAQRKAGRPNRIHHTRAKALTLNGSETLYMQIDGDPILFSGKACVQIEPQAFSIHVPSL